MSLEVEIRFATPGIVAASVRDAAGIADVRWTRTGQWTCSACPGRACRHIGAVHDVVSRPRATDALVPTGEVA